MKWTSMLHHHETNVMSDVVSTKNMDSAFDHVCQRRKKTSANNDIWYVRFHWKAIKQRLQGQLLSGHYHISPMQCCQALDGLVSSWTAEDAIVLRAIAQVLGPIVGKYDDERCYHLKGRGDLKAAIGQVDSRIKRFNFVVRSDVAHYAIYMDDWVILTKTRGVLRRAVKWMHQVMQKLGFKLALDKTYIGRIKNGFDFLGYRFNDRGIIGLATKTIRNFIERLRVLYEQNVSALRIAQYVRRWISWFMAGLA